MVKALRLVSGVAVFDVRSGPVKAVNRRGDGEFGSWWSTRAIVRSVEWFF